MDTMVYLLAAALVVFVFLGDVRRVRLPERLRASSVMGTCPGAPYCERCPAGAGAWP
jgi:hypothetical protein